LSDFGVEYGDPKVDTKAEFSDDSTTAAENFVRRPLMESSGNMFAGLPECEGSTDTSTEGSCDDAVSQRWQTPPALPSASMVPPAMFPMQMGGASMPGTFAAPQGAQMYLMSFAPNGAQVLMPVASAGMPIAQAGMTQAGMTQAGMTQVGLTQSGMTQAVMTPAGMPQWNTTMMNPTVAQQHTAAVGSLEARAAALSAHAAEVRAAARRAKAAAAAARRHSNSGDQEDFRQMTPMMDFDKFDGVLAGGVAPRTTPDDRTTLMLRNLPLNYTRTAVLDMLDSEGFAGTYCFVYVPTDFKNFTGFGYAFVGFCAHDDAARAKRHYQGFSRWKVPSQKTCDMAWSGPVQGLEQHTERYRNSPVMHPGVPDEYKPAVFVNGVRATFPAPTKRIRPPRLRHSIAGEVLAPGPLGEGHNSGRRIGRRSA